MISYQFNKNNDILEVWYSGKITFNDLVSFGDKIYLNESLPRKLLIITDVTEGTYDLNMSDIDQLIPLLRKHVSAFDYIKAAFVQSQPRETAYSMLLSKKSIIPNYFHKVFSTREAALDWLLAG